MELMGGNQMFLHRLNSSEKEAFLSLSIHVSAANGKIDASEYEMLEAYCKEMEIRFFDPRNAMEMERIISVFKDSDPGIKKAVLIEIMGLAYADSSYDVAEQAMITDFAKRIGVDETEIKVLRDLMIRYLDLTKEMMEAVK